MVLRVTFDSNCWQRVVRPKMFSRDHRYALFEALHHAVKDRRVAGYISETVGTLEAIRRTTRGDYLAAERLSVVSEDTSGVDGGLRGLVTIGAAHSLHPGLPGILTDMLQEAFGMGFRLLVSSRLGTVRPALFVTPEGDFRSDIYARSGDDDDIERRMEAFGEVACAIEGRGVGHAMARALSREIQSRTSGPLRPWATYLKNPANPAEARAIDNAVAEWADGDAIASHIAYGLDVFCTEDLGKSAGCSVFSAEHRTWLTEAYSVRFRTLEELASDPSLSNCRHAN